jgi:tetratricopeptide (TPR) repeat protein
MKRVILSFAVIGLLNAAAHAAETPLERATKFYKMNMYENAVRLHRFLGNVRPEEKGRAYLSLGVFLLSDSALHGELHEASLSVNLDYLKKLASVKGRDRSRIVNLYMAETLLEAGEPKQASFYFAKVIKDAKAGARQKALAKVGLGLAFYLRGQRQKAQSTWSGLEGTADPEVLSELAFAYSRAGLTGRNPEGMCDKALGMIKKKEEASIRVIKNAAGVYASAGLVQKGLNLLWNADLKASSYEEVLGENKIIRFYDPALMGNLSKLYAQASVHYLKKALEASGSADMARYYLGEAYFRLGRAEESSASSGAVTSSSSAPKKLKGPAKVRQAAAMYRKGGKAEAVKRLERLSGEYAKVPLMQAEVLLACGTLGADCKGSVSRAESLAEAGEGRKIARLNHALGRYYLGSQNYDRAISFMEGGRDKSNKNRIEHNDPAMLVNLAVAYYGIKKFSEALEIFFEMSKQFPAVRQIQAALQGIYSVEQKSAGDVKVL